MLIVKVVLDNQSWLFEAVERITVHDCAWIAKDMDTDYRLIQFEQESQGTIPLDVGVKEMYGRLVTWRESDGGEKVLLTNVSVHIMNEQGKTIESYWITKHCS